MKRKFKAGLKQVFTNSRFYQSIIHNSQNLSESIQQMNK